MIKRGRLFQVVLLIFLLVPSVLAQQLQPFGDFIRNTLDQEFFMFILFLLLFTIVFVSSLRKLLPQSYANIIGGVTALILDFSLMTSGVLDGRLVDIFGQIGLWALGLVGLLILISIYAMIVGKDKLKIGWIIAIVIISVLLFLLLSGTWSLDGIYWNYVIIALSIIALLLLILGIGRAASNAPDTGKGFGDGIKNGLKNLGNGFKWIGNAVPHPAAPWKWKSWPWKKNNNSTTSSPTPSNAGSGSKPYKGKIRLSVPSVKPGQKIMINLIYK